MNKLLTSVFAMLMVLGTSAASDKLSIGDYSIVSGEGLLLPISLENETELSAFQCDVYLPEGIALALNNEGDWDVTLNSERATSSHSVIATTQSDGAIRIAAYSTSSKVFKGNTGELFYLNLTTDAEVEGEKTVTLKNIIFSTATAEEVRLKDVTGTIMMNKYVPKNDFVLQDVEVNAGDSLLYPIVLTNDNELAAFQCDIYLPEGLTLRLNEEGDLDVRLSERATSAHTITARTQTDGSIRIAAYANPTKVFKGNDGVLFYLNLQADKNSVGEKVVEIKKIICSTADASTVQVTDAKAIVNVLEAAVLVSEIQLQLKEQNAESGQTNQLLATVIPENADNKTLTWTSSDESIAIVDETGMVTFVGSGTVVITAAATDGSGVEATYTIYVGLNGIGAVITDDAVETIYYSVTGEASWMPHKGINVIKRTFKDGHVEISKLKR